MMAPRSSRYYLRSQTRPVEITEKKYAYEALPTTTSIRLLQLWSNSDTIRCTLKIVSLDEAPAYTALSYCWGAPKGTIPIVYGDTRDVLHVTPNLYSYLKQLNNGALEDVPDYLWIDALCINQDDNLERGSQVSIMRDIYRQAEKVDIWLGEATEDSELAIDWMTKTHAAISEPLSRVYLPKSEDIREMTAIYRKTYKTLQPSRFEWNAIMSLIDCPWFKRVWVIQEKWMAQRAYFVCGHRRWDPEVIHPVAVSAMMFDVLQYDMGHNELSNLSNMNSILSLNNRPSRLLWLLVLSRRFLATDLRDKVFALLGLADETGYDRTILTPDYSMSATDVFSRCAFAIMSAEKSLDVLSDSTNVDTSRNNLILPSWVPNWTRPSTMVCLLGDFSPWKPIGFTEWRSSGGSSASVKMNADERMLALCGFIVDEIEIIAAALNISAVNTEIVAPRAVLEQTEILLEWEAFSRRWSEGIYEPTKESITDVYQKLLSAGRDDSKGELSKETFLKWEQLRLPRTTMKPDSMTEAEWLTHLYMGKSFSERKWCTYYVDLIVQNNRRLIRTKGGYLGLVPKTAEIGDVIAICQGGRVPLTLRPHGENFQLVGDAYVHGMMRGERYEESKCKLMWLV